MRKSIALAAAAVVAASTAVLTAGPASADSGPQPNVLTFGYTGQARTFTVPDGVIRIYLSATGGAGGDGYSDVPCVHGSGGTGGTVAGYLDVHPGEQLSLFVGSGGHLSGPGGVSGPDASRTGGAGGANGDVGSGNGGGGGGATTVTYAGSSVMVAGGGGGGGGRGISSLQCGGDGGAGGVSPQPGYNGTASTPGAYGLGGGTYGTNEQMPGGHGFGWSGAGGGGGAGDGAQPGQGGHADQSTLAAGGGGGGGGGSSVAGPRLDQPQYSTSGAHGASGSVSIVWGQVTSTSVPPATALGGYLPLHAIVTGTDGGGTVDFSYPLGTGSVPIDGCSGVALVSVGDGVDFEASCNAATQLVGSDTVTATYSGDYAYGASTGSNTYGITQLSTTTSASAATTSVQPFDTAYLTVTVSGSDGYGSVSLSDDGAPLPGACNPLSANGSSATSLCHAQIVSGAHALVATYSGDRGYRGSQSAVVTVTAAGEPSISGTPPAGTVGKGYAFGYSLAGDPSPTMSVTGGALPPGLTLSSDGQITGTPTTAGTYSYTVTASNPVGNVSLTSTTTIAAGSIARKPDLAVSLQRTGSFVAGSSSGYAVVVSNVGTGRTTSSVTAKVSIASGLRPVRVAGSGWHCVVAAQSATCSHATPIRAGHSSTINVTVKVMAPAGTVVTTGVTVTPTDASPANNAASDRWTIASA